MSKSFSQGTKQKGRPARSLRAIAVRGRAGERRWGSHREFRAGCRSDGTNGETRVPKD